MRSAHPSQTPSRGPGPGAAAITTPRSSTADVRVHICCTNCDAQIGIYENRWICLTSSYMVARSSGTVFATVFAGEERVIPASHEGRLVAGCTVIEARCRKCEKSVGQKCVAPGEDLETEGLIGKVFYKLSRTRLANITTRAEVDPVFDLPPSSKKAASRIKPASAAQRDSYPGAGSSRARSQLSRPNRRRGTSARTSEVLPIDPRLFQDDLDTGMEEELSGLDQEGPQDAMEPEVEVESGDTHLILQRLAQQSQDMKNLFQSVNKLQSQVTKFTKSMEQMKKDRSTSGRADPALIEALKSAFTRRAPTDDRSSDRLQAENDLLRKRLSTLSDAMSAALAEPGRPELTAQNEVLQEEVAPGPVPTTDNTIQAHGHDTNARPSRSIAMEESEAAQNNYTKAAAVHDSVNASSTSMPDGLPPPASPRTVNCAEVSFAADKSPAGRDRTPPIIAGLKRKLNPERDPRASTKKIATLKLSTLPANETSSYKQPITQANSSDDRPQSRSLENEPVSDSGIGMDHYEENTRIPVSIADSDDLGSPELGSPEPSAVSNHEPPSSVILDATTKSCSVPPGAARSDVNAGTDVEMQDALATLLRDQASGDEINNMGNPYTNAERSIASVLVELGKVDAPLQTVGNAMQKISDAMSTSPTKVLRQQAEQNTEPVSSSKPAREAESSIQNMEHSQTSFASASQHEDIDNTDKSNVASALNGDGALHEPEQAKVDTQLADQLASAQASVQELAITPSRIRPKRQSQKRNSQISGQNGSTQTTNETRTPVAVTIDNADLQPAKVLTPNGSKVLVLNAVDPAQRETQASTSVSAENVPRSPAAVKRSTRSRTGKLKPTEKVVAVSAKPKRARKSAASSRPGSVETSMKSNSNPAIDPKSNAISGGDQSFQIQEDDPASHLQSIVSKGVPAKTNGTTLFTTSITAAADSHPRPPFPQTFKTDSNPADELQGNVKSSPLPLSVGTSPPQTQIRASLPQPTIAVSTTSTSTTTSPSSKSKTDQQHHQQQDGRRMKKQKNVNEYVSAAEIERLVAETMAREEMMAL